MSLLEATSVTVRYPGHDERGRRLLWAAVDGVSLTVAEGERVGIIGESGSGKTTLGKALLGMEPVAQGTVLFRGEQVHGLKGRALEAFRLSAQMIFQDPMGSLNPRMTIGAALDEVLSVHKLATRAERPARIQALLQQVGLDNGYTRRYPHEFSGGQRQRIGIARALALNPALLVADEPVSALDVSVQAQILNLIRDLSEARQMAVVLVAHDLAVVNYVCQRVLIMYKGQVVEEGPAQEVFRHPRHPYTQLLKASVPDPDDIAKRPGNGLGSPGQSVTSAVQSSTGCAFAPRCSQAQSTCFTDKPALRETGEGSRVRCDYAPSPLIGK
jgi:oligopeptide/dipeptide ABC transporter ATP-binding protein